MKRNLSNFVAITALMVLLLFGFTSCTSVAPPTTGVVTITLDIEPAIILGVNLELTKNGYYYIYMDDVYQGTMTSSGALTLEDVFLGMHTFKASNYLINGDSVNLNNNDTQKEVKLAVNGYTNCSGSIIYEVKPGVNYVTIPVYCGLIMVE
jgi:hypothetical protein